MPFVLSALGVAAYANSFGGVFLLDDVLRITDSARVRHLASPWQVVTGTSRPLLYLSLAVNWSLGALNVWGYHAVNLAIHLLAGLTLFGIVRRMLESERLKARYGSDAPWLALAIAAIWLVHPLQTAAVTYVIQRGESLMGLFYLATLYSLIRGSESRGSQHWFALGIVACALGMASKEVMVTAPLMMLLYDRIFLSSSFGEIARRRARFYLGLAATWALLALFVLTSRAEEQNVIAAPLSSWRYLMAQLQILVHYLRLAVWPHPLVFDYAWQAPQALSSVLPSAALVIALAIGTGLALWRLPWVGFWGVWFFLILAPTSSILPIVDLAFEHRMYLPLAAVVVLFVLGARDLLGLALSSVGGSLAVRRWLPATLVVATVAALGFTTIRRNEDYRSEYAMWSDTVARRPGNPRAHANLANALAAQGRTDDAVAHLVEALRLQPDYVVAHGNLGTLLYRQGRTAESLEHFSEAVRLKPDSARAHTNLAFAFFMLGRNKDAIVHYAEAVRLNPGSAWAHQSLGAALNREGRVDEAIAQFTEAVRLKPDFAEARQSLDTALARQGKTAGAPVRTRND